ncbi:VOC family protein [Cohnella silvisoli]|uniref:VOC family protein n=1 Tax=Cohnella silvisoli TaxID=2873699 RepID=A0ABV1L486_9BACL|nr:VOC family protein [Cohnella silvisoli]MCD9026406.1 VOC family protein [Cohnella silvisoli]
MSDAKRGLMQPITPHLWFDKEAKEAAEFYCSIFPDSKITSTTALHDTPSGDCDLVSFLVCGHPFMAISAGPLFNFNPSISFIVNFDPSREMNAREKIDEVWSKLSEGGISLMALDKYPFSERYGWIQDKYGVSWQLILTNPDGEPRPTIVPSLMFVGNNCGKAEEAREFYLSVFRNAKPGTLFRYGPDLEPDKEGTVMFTDFMLENTWFAAMDSAQEHKFQFNEAISLLVECQTQEEIDYYWEKLSALSKAEQCGWLKDKYGVSWQISPAALDEMMTKGTPEQRDRVTKAFLKMKKFNIAELQRAFLGN